MALQLDPTEIDQSPLEIGREWQIVQRVLESSAFIRSNKLKSFLIYVAERGISGRTDEITEQQIGVAVFGRPADYSPGEDSIVRSQARLLRAKLDVYFDGEGIHEPLRITIPKGTYIPIFEERLTAASAVSMHETIECDSGTKIVPTNLGSPSRLTPQAHWSFERYCFVLSLLLLAALSAWVVHKNWNVTEYQRLPTHAFWAKVFDPARPTVIVTTDSGLAMQNDLTGRGVTLDEYMSGKSREQLDARAENGNAIEYQLAGRRYVTLVDLHVTQQLIKLPEATSTRTVVVFARDLKTDDLKHSNLILLGARASNPWVNLFWNDLDFVIDRDFVTHDATIFNRRPRNGEPPSYHYSPREPARIYYCAIAFEPSSQDSGSHLLIQGTSMVGVQMCAETMFDGSRWTRVLSAVGSGGALRGFEILMRSGGPENGTASSQILATHVH